jgi:hypothetical protein
MPGKMNQEDAKREIIQEWRALTREQRQTYEQARTVRDADKRQIQIPREKCGALPNHQGTAAKASITNARVGLTMGDGNAEMTYDVYQGATDNSLRMATRPGAGLPRHVDSRDRKLMPAGTSQLIDDIDVDITDRGFCFSRLVSK